MLKLKSAAASSSHSIISSPNNWFIVALCFYFFAQFHEDLIAMEFGASASPTSYCNSYYCYGVRRECPKGNAYLIACDAVLSVIAVLYFLTRLSKSSSSSSSKSLFSVWSGLLHITLPVGLMSLLAYSCAVLISFVPLSCGSSNPTYRRVLVSKALMIIVLAFMMMVDVTTGVLLSGFPQKQRSPSSTISSSDAEQVENAVVCSRVRLPSFSLSSFLSLFSLTGRLLFIVSFLMLPLSISSIAVNSVAGITISFNVVLAVIYAACLLITVVSHRLLWWRIHQQQQGEQQAQQQRSRLHSLFPSARLLASSTVRRQLSSKSVKQAPSASSSSIPASSLTVAPSSYPSSSASASASSSSSSTSSILLGGSDPLSHQSELTNASLMQPMIYLESDIDPSLSASAPPQPSSSSSSSSSCSVSSTPLTSRSQSSSFSFSGTRALLAALLCLFTVVMFVFALVTLIVEMKHRTEADTQAIFVTSLNFALVTITMIRILFAFGCFLRRTQIQIHFVATKRNRKGKKGEGEGEGEVEGEVEGEDEDEDDEQAGEERMEVPQHHEPRDGMASSIYV